MAKIRVSKEEPPHVKLMRKLEMVDYEPGSDPYTFPFSYGYRGYSFAERVADFRTEHIIEVCGLVTNVTYNVLVCIWDKSGNGPICSRNITIFLPTP